MRNNVEILHQGENALQQTIRNGEATIDEVKKEEQTELMVERQQLREDLRSLKMAINKIVVRNAISSFSVAIVDLLQLDQVVETLKTDVVRGAKRLCASRTSVGQYLTQGDDPMVIAYKKLILREKLHSMNTAVKKWLDGAYPGLVDEVKRHLDADIWFSGCQRPNRGTCSFLVDVMFVKCSVRVLRRILAAFRFGVSATRYVRRQHLVRCTYSSEYCT